MNQIKDAYNNSKNSVNEMKQARIDREHALVLESIKREFGVTDFSKVSDIEKAELRRTVLEYWDPKEGLTKKGLKYINEGVSSVNEASSADTIKRNLTGKINGYLRQWVDGTMAPAEVEAKISEALIDIRESGAKINVGSVKNKESVKGIVAEQVCKLFCAKISSFKF